jgi:NADPH:quinone reductase-like Zn-dependent oxidoreductase
MQKPAMKAVFLTGTNQPLEVRDTPPPQPAEDEVLIKLSFSAFNHRDVWMQQGKYSGPKSGLILGSDGVGKIVATGDPSRTKSSHDSLAGDPVIINPSHDWGDDPRAFGKDFKILGNPGPGTFAEYICVKRKYVHAKPPHLTDEEAAALPLAGLTTYRAVFTRGNILPGEKVLVTGIGAGTALLALPFALAAGAEVYVTSSSSEKIEKAKALGATAGFIYKDDDWMQQAKKATNGGFDVILDSASGRTFYQLLDVARPGGRIVFWGGADTPIGNILQQRIFWKNLSLLGTTMGTQQEFAGMLECIKKFRIRPTVDRVFSSLDQAQEAIAYMAQGRQFGKIVLTNR